MNKKIISIQFMLMFALLACSSKPLTSRTPSHEQSFETLCNSKIDSQFPKLTVASLYHRDHSEFAKKLKLAFDVQIKMNDGTINMVNVPSYQNPESTFQEVSGIKFPLENNVPYVEYNVLTRMNWAPLNASFQFPYLESGWKKTEMAGVCLDLNPPVPFIIQISGDLASKGITKISRVRVNYEVSGKKIEYYVPFVENLATSEVLIPSSGLQLTFQITLIQNGQVLKTTPKVLSLQASQDNVIIQLNESELN